MGVSTVVDPTTMTTAQQHTVLHEVAMLTRAYREWQRAADAHDQAVKSKTTPGDELHRLADVRRVAFNRYTSAQLSAARLFDHQLPKEDR